MWHPLPIGHTADQATRERSICPMKKEIRKSGYTLTFEESTGKWTGLYDTVSPQSNWLAENDKHGFCKPFIHGTQQGEDDLPCPFTYSDNTLKSSSPWGATNVEAALDEDRIRIHFSTEPDHGSRAGLQMNLNFLDLPTEGTWQSQCMPKVIYVEESYQYAYFVFATADHRYMVLTVSFPLAAWRILYSYEGHKMTGFQLLTQADDVITDGRGALPIVDTLEIQIQFAGSLSDCFAKISDCLGISIAMPAISGGQSGSRIPFDVIGNCTAVQIQDPDGKISIQKSLVLEKTGMYKLITLSPNGRKHISHVLCHEDWETQFDRINRFYKTYFQDKTGAFYRAISSDTLKPDKKTFEGVPFGDPYEHFSCRTGEFGGFAAWSMIKNQLVFGEKPEFTNTVQRYLFDWALNRGHEDNPYCGTVYKKPNTYRGRDYGSYHFYEESNYLQHEIFLLEQMADYYRLYKDASVLPDALALADHIFSEHMREDGAVINQNTADDPGIDYSTVHPAACGFLRLAEAIKTEAPEKSRYLLSIAEKIADYVCKRALDFPTEGEPCTEDGSMGCSAATLLYAYMYIAPKPEYLRVAREILDAHHVLELNGTDCRMKNSTIRFWETQYETREWGPSINSGHAWTIWTSESKAMLALLDHDADLLQEAYEGFITNICKVDSNGGMFCCYTPDMIPGTPHAHYNPPKDDSLEHNDMRPTSTHLGMAYPKKAYSASGNYYLIKAAEIWSHISGLNLNSGAAINGVYEDNLFLSAAKNLDTFVLSGKSSKPIRLKCHANQIVKILFDEKSTPHFTDGKILSQDDTSCTVLCEKSVLTMKV